MIPILTIGHSGRDLDEFLEVLRQHQITYLIDVRSRPYTRYHTHFSRNELEENLRIAGIRYVFMGDTLGGRPDDPECYDGEGRVNYAVVGQKDFYLAGIDRLLKAHSQGLHVVLMCSEGEPQNCHRSKLIGETLYDRGVAVQHIDRQNAVLDHVEVMHSIPRQIHLFDGDPGLTSIKGYRVTNEIADRSKPDDS